VSPFAKLVSNILVIAAIVIIMRKLAPYIESKCADLGMESFYNKCAGVAPTLIILGVLRSVAAFALPLVLKSVIK
jgi:hypothetical protein